MSGDSTPQPPQQTPPSGAEGEQAQQPPQQAPQQGPAEQENAPPPGAVPQPPPPPPNEQFDPNANPWLSAPPPTFQQAPEGFPPDNFGPPQPPPYEGGPMPQPFDGGMLPPPYPPPQAPYDANGTIAPPLEQLPPYPSEQLPPQNPEPPAQPYVPFDINTGQPIPPDPSPGGQPYPPFDPNIGQPYPQDPNMGGQLFPPFDPHTGQPYPPDPNMAGQQFPPFDPSTGQPYAQDPGMVGQPYPPSDPNAAGQQLPPIDPSTGQPYAQDPGMVGQQFPPIDPNTGQPYPRVDPNTGQPYAQVDPNTGQPYAQVDPNTGQPYVPIDPNTGQPVQGYGYPQGYPGQAQQPQNADSLSSENLLGERRIAPSSGWRRAVYKATAGSIHPGESQGDLRRKDLIARARTVVAGGHHRVAVMSLKGGVGKTTTTTGLGSMLGSLRGDTVIAVDANPDRGTLSDKVKLETAATVRDLLNSRDRIQRYADVRAFTSQNNARLEVLASDRDPAVSEAFSAEDYAAVAVVLEQYYSICITDCGTGLLHSAMAGVLSLADQLVLVSSPSVDGARSASATLDWLEAHDHGHLVRNGVVVLSMVRNRTRSQVDLDKLQAHFESRCRAVVRIPYDDHLEEGAEVELEQLAPATREAYLNLAAVVGDGFAYQRPQA
ncbi:hypothetical protein GCM10022254_56440 [Actinomadura meridiana]|uniref:CobQ/CobB/MinD/ParA nucleotide binding domain-containing protein n=2 Tax=Actinomadura meridiana TaxID=559626 RepID=A0ABP8CFY7_9ACTN